MYQLEREVIGEEERVEEKLEEKMIEVLSGGQQQFSSSVDAFSHCERSMQQ